MTLSSRLKACLVRKDQGQSKPASESLWRQRQRHCGLEDQHAHLLGGVLALRVLDLVLVDHEVDARRTIAACRSADQTLRLFNLTAPEPLTLSDCASSRRMGFSATTSGFPLPLAHLPIDDQGILVAIFSRRSPLVVVAGSGGPARGMQTAARLGWRLAAPESSCASDSACLGHPPR